MNNLFQILKAFLKDPTLFSMKVLYGIWVIGFLLRFIVSFTNQEYIDYIEFRLPIAEALARGDMLYRDYPYNHMPIYPYLSGFMYIISPKDPIIVSVFIRLPMTIADSLIPFAIFILMKNLNQKLIGAWASILYALNPISIKEIGFSHWDGMATLFLLLTLIAIIKHESEKTGFWSALGFGVKIYPLAMLLPGILYMKSIYKTFKMISIAFLVSIFILGTFLVYCPEQFVTGILTHPVYSETASEGVIVGSVASVFRYFGSTTGKMIWAGLFAIALLIPIWKFKKEALLPFVSIIYVLFSIFWYVTHRQMLVMLLPFAFILLAQNWKRSLIPVILIGIGYWVKLIKPHFAWGLIILLGGAWLYLLFYQDMGKIGELVKKSQNSKSALYKPR